MSLFGWWGRGDGWLALASAALLLLAASTLTKREVERAIGWLLAGGAVVAVIGILEAVGVQLIANTYPGVDSTLGNPNFAAGYTAMLAVLAVGRAVQSQYPIWQRVSVGLLALGLAAMSTLTGSLQGPAALAAGLIAGWVVLVLAYRGGHRLVALGATGVALVAGLVLLALSLVGVGPLRILWADYTVQVRQEYWRSAWDMMLGQPIFGSGPDGFARFVSEYRPESYIELLGPVRRVSAGHNIALQFGATLGVLGLLLWTLMMLGLAVMLLIRASRAQITPVVLIAGVGGAWVTYLVQGMVSIDMLPVLALGWLLTGLLVAALKDGGPPPPEVQSSGRNGSGRGRAGHQGEKRSTAVLVGAGAGIALVPFVLVLGHISAVNAVGSVQSLDQAVAVVNNPQTPCPLRVNLVQTIQNSVEPQQAAPIVLDAFSVDPRCAPMATTAAQVALSQGDLTLANELTSQAIQFDPLFDLAWLLRAEYELAVGDTSAARSAVGEAERLARLYPDLTDAAPADISDALADLKRRIDAAA